VWNRVVKGRTLHFRIAGLNHQNLLLMDEETGSWWQQVTGECILGPLRSERLRRIASEEVTLAVWRSERPKSTAVRFDPRYQGGYAASDWERGIEKIPAPGTRELVVGIERNGGAAAFPLAALRLQSPLNTQVGGAQILILVGADGASVRSFERPSVNGQTLEFFRQPGRENLVDSVTGSVWSFAGKALSGPLAGRTLEPVQNTKDYWFDWSHYHPGVKPFRAGR
jgi:hypothetical protein